jgi:hypothetical protein
LIAPRKPVVRESSVRADKNVVFNAYAVPKLDPAVDRHTIPHQYIILNERMVADVAIPPDSGALQYMRKGLDPRAVSYLRSLHQGSLVLEECHG